jgi:predicted enzyme related to lactoylglutathione lyase
MSDFNALHNRAVWFDIPVSDLGRAAEFYRAVLGVKVDDVDAGGYKFCVIEHTDGNGGCLVPNAKEISGSAGILLYMNVHGRIRDAVAKTPAGEGRCWSRRMASAPTAFAQSCWTAKATGSRSIRPSMPEGHRMAAA